MLALVPLLLPTGAHADGAGGFAEVRFTSNIGVDGPFWQVVERVRPRLDLPIGDRVKLVATLEAGFAQGRRTQQVFQDLVDASDFGPLLDLAGCTWPPGPTNHLLQIDGPDDYLDVDRLHLDVYLPWMDLRVGRQALNWGSAMMINPTDPFPEVLFTEPWRPRRGVNAVRALFPLDPRTDLSAIVATNDTFDTLRAATRLRSRVGTTDVAVVAAWRGDEGEQGGGLIGVDVRGTLGVGFWFEGALHLESEIYEELAVGIDYSFPVLQSLIVMAQYYRSGAPDAERAALSGGNLHPPDCELPEQAVGQPPPDGALALLTASPDAAPDPFAPAFGSHDYLLASVSLGILRELSVNLVALQNLNDGTGFFVPTLGVRPAGWLDISASAQVPYRLGKEGGEFKPDPDSMAFEEDLGPLLGVRSLDLSGLLPDAVITVWTRVSF